MLPVKAKHDRNEFGFNSQTCGLYCVSPLVESRPGTWLSRTRLSSVFLIFMIIPETGHARLLSNTSKFVIHQPPYYSTL